jgi:predicted small secreted protein
MVAPKSPRLADRRALPHRPEAAARPILDLRSVRNLRLNLPKRIEKMKTLMIVLLGFLSLSLSACNTIGGAGKDVKATGAAVEKAADNAKTY